MSLHIEAVAVASECMLHFPKIINYRLSVLMLVVTIIDTVIEEHKYNYIVNASSKTQNLFTSACLG